MKILVANRGEIALRIMRTIREMGFQSVAVYSDADRLAPFVRYADEAIHIGPSPSSESYLVGSKIIKAALNSGAEAIHPGYGFLSENPEFAKNVAKAKLVFIGPSASSMKIMGNKLKAKKAVSKFNIPLVPGTDEPVANIGDAKKFAKQIGYPVLIKAASGGGGKGMRVVEKDKDVAEQFDRAVSEAKAAFGDGTVFIEKYIKSPRHIEIQIMIDRMGNSIHFFERECSIQRRHQKVIEEAPSPLLTNELRNEMGEVALEVAHSCKYEGAGTVEFIVDDSGKDKIKYYFLEMNTRLQVEHPITEMITGYDLVKLQILIAQGKPLKIKQQELSIKGHAIELRIYSEDPENDFLPNTGTLNRYAIPSGPGVRVDGGYTQGMEIPVEYDPLISKLIVHAGDRLQAIERMKRAIAEYKISGIQTTLSFGNYVMNHKAFVQGRYTTNFVRDHFNTRQSPNSNTNDSNEQLVVALAALERMKINAEPKRTPVQSKSGMSNWRKNRTAEE